MTDLEQQSEASEERNLNGLTTGTEGLYASSTTLEHFKEANVAEMYSTSDKLGLQKTPL